MAIFFFALQDGNTCVSDPLVYGAERATGDDQGKLMCSCSFSNPFYASFYFDNEGLFAFEEKDFGVKSELITEDLNNG